MKRHPPCENICSDISSPMAVRLFGVSKTATGLKLIQPPFIVVDIAGHNTSVSLMTAIEICFSDSVGDLFAQCQLLFVTNIH